MSAHWCCRRPRVGPELHRDLSVFKDHSMRDALLGRKPCRTSKAVALEGIPPEVGVADPAVERVLPPHAVTPPRRPEPRHRPADLVALLVAAVAASRLSLLPTVLVAIASAGLLRGFLSGSLRVALYFCAALFAVGAILVEFVAHDPHSPLRIRPMRSSSDSLAEASAPSSSASARSRFWRWRATMRSSMLSLTIRR